MPPKYKRDRGGGRGRGRGSKRGRDRDGDCGEGSRHPPHLKGREIGLFYSKRSQANKAKNDRRPLGTVLLSPAKRAQIQAKLETIKSEAFKSGEIADSHFKRDFLNVINETLEEKLKRSTGNIEPDLALDQKLIEQFAIVQTDDKYQRMMKKRMNLPSFKMQAEVLEKVNSNQIVVISGETGCGKTTQVAQFILDDYIKRGVGSTCRIICTQPRRISAITVAERVAEERAERLGNSVGYQIRLETRAPRDRGSIIFCTTGVVLKKMENDPALSQYSHLILDEIHERDVMSDFILALVKRLVLQRSDLKVILMSATLNSEKFSNYYNNAPHLNIPGFTYPVSEYYLEDVIERTNFQFPVSRVSHNSKVANREFSDFIEPHVRLLESERKYSRNTCIQLRNPESEKINCELIVELIKDICKRERDQGAILVFVTGFVEISKVSQMLEEGGDFPKSRFLIFPLHSLMPTLDQKQIFETPPNGKRKIVIATNIAETSITIDDVVFVIDCGRIKMSNFDVATNSKTLNPEWVTLANASQRKGRAGRVKPGVCFHLYSKAREMQLNQYPLPEILRTRLEDTILTTKLLQLGKIEPFFAQLIDSPDPESVALSLDLLKRLDALTDEEVLTPLGFHLAKLPMAPQMGKMILFGAIFSCLDPILSIAAVLDFKDPFQLPIGKEDLVTERKLELSNGILSDHLIYHEVLKYFEGNSNSRDYCWRNFLSFPTLKLLANMKRQFMEYLYQMNFVPNSNPKTEECNRNTWNVSLVKAIICAGLYPNVGISHKMGRPPFYTEEGLRMEFHPKSILTKLWRMPSDFNLLVYYEKVKSSSTFIHDASLMHPLPVIFFGDHFTQATENEHHMILISNKLKFKCTESTAGIIKELRDRFNWFLEYKISHPGPILWRSAGDNEAIKVLEIIMDLITCEDMEDFEAYDDYD